MNSVIVNIVTITIVTVITIITVAIALYNSFDLLTYFVRLPNKITTVVRTSYDTITIINIIYQSLLDNWSK